MQLSHRDFGGAGRPPLIVLHGMLGSSRNWQSVGADLAERHHVFALDLRNHGRSPHEAGMGYAAMAADVLAWMDGQGIGRAGLMGHSMGGKIAMLIACRYPERVERLVVVDIAPKDYRSAAHRAEFAAMNELDLRTLQSRGEAELKFEARVPDWAMRKFLTTNLERDEAGGGWRWMVNLPAITAALTELEKTPLVVPLAEQTSSSVAAGVGGGDRYGGPVLFVTGGKSRYVLEEDWVGIERHFPQVKRAVIAESGHNPHMEMREAFVRAVVAE